MRAMMVLCCVAVAIVIATVSTSRGDGESTDVSSTAPTDDTTEPITGTAVMPLPGSDEQPIKDPFAPYEIGGQAAAWRKEDLTAAEQAVVDRGLADDQAAVHDAWAEAARGRSAQAKAGAAAALLGVDGPFGELGVVP